MLTASGLNTTARLALYGKPLPRIEDAVRVAEWLRFAVVGKAGRMLGEDNVPAVLSGHDLPAGNRHERAFYLPEDADGDGFIDHLVVHAPGGLDAPSRRVLGALARLWTRDGLEWQVILEAMGASEQFADSSCLLRSSREWRSATPYLHPWYVKKRFTVEDQLRRECRERGLPEPVDLAPVDEVEVSAGSRRRPIHFHRFRSKRGLTQPDRHGSFWRLVFPEPVRGPLALGFGCHFGLGLFRPAQPDGA
jgi:CRISPR-associated protein Csb2